jgi:hypothetical protein
MNFRVGQKVVCVDDDWGWISAGSEYLPTRLPMLNEVLTISDLSPGSGGFGSIENETYLYFEEIPRRQSSGYFSASISYLWSHFRPLVERKTDISIFHQIARDVENNVPVFIGEQA